MRVLLAQPSPFTVHHPPPFPNNLVYCAKQCDKTGRRECGDSNINININVNFLRLLGTRRPNSFREIKFSGAGEDRILFCSPQVQ